MKARRVCDKLSSDVYRVWAELNAKRQQMETLLGAEARLEQPRWMCGALLCPIIEISRP